MKRKLLTKSLLLFVALICNNLGLHSQTGTTTLVSMGANGKLIYNPDAKGNIIPDFSCVGYKSGDLAIPNVAVVQTLTAVAGDNRTNIQNAINQIGNLPLNANGFRGALLLKAGTYNISGTITINKSGIVLIGEGNGTIFYATGKTQHNLINVTGSGGAAAIASTSKKIQGAYLPIGRKTFTVEAGHTFAVGDNVFLQRKPNQAWISMLGMDKLDERDAADKDWTPGAYTYNYKRKVVAVNGNNITLDAPLVDPIDAQYAEGFIMKYSWTGKVENIGIQNIYFDSYYASTTDENHGWDAIRMDNVENAWVRNIEAHHFGYSAVNMGGGCSQISVLDSKCLDPISQTTGGRKYSFSVNGQRILVKNCTTRGGRHDYVTGSGTAGPNAFVNCTATGQRADIGPHHRWATGILFDNVTGNGEQNVQNRLTSGSGHGWAGAQTMFWNCTGSRFKVQSPPNHINWAIGCKGVVTDDGNYHDGNPGVWQSTNNPIKTPSSLYEQQLCERLGTCGQSNCTPTAINPYVRVNGGAWQNSTNASANSGESVQFGPQPVNGGSWKWNGPNGFSATSREVTITNIQANQAGDYIATYTNDGGCTSTATFKINVILPNQNPVVNITTPTNNASFNEGDNIYVSANASDADGTIAKVELFNGNTLVAIEGQTPYEWNITGLTAGTYTLTAIATDDKGATTTSTSITVEVKKVNPCIPATASADDGNVPANVLDGNLNTRWSANGDGQWIQFCLANITTFNTVKIAFFNGNGRTSTFDILTSNDAQSWNTIASGVKSSGTTLQLENFTVPSQTVKYIRIVGHGNSTNLWNSFTEVEFENIIVQNKVPSVSITAPFNGLNFTAPASINITANAADSDGSVTKVEFFNGSTKLGEDATAPYAFAWNNVAAGNYSITAIATDNQGAQTTSAAVNISVSNCTPTAIVPYFRVNGAAWQQATNATMNVGDAIQFGPQPTKGGSWSWNGPNNFTAASREITVSNIQSNQAGNYIATHTNAGGCESTATFNVTVNTPAPSQTPYTSVINIPGTVQAENFDKGGEGIAYHDLTAANEGGQYRITEAVDIEACTEGGYNVGWIGAGEWLEYTVNVIKAANYDFNIRYASTQTGSLRIEMNGVNITNTVNTTNTNGWQNWNTVSAKNIALTTGTKVMRIYVISGAFNLNYIEVKEYIATPPVTSKFKVVGYMPSWAGDVNAIQYSKLTDINYSFIRPTATGGLTAVENPAKLTSLVAKAHAANVRVGIAIGGWSNLNNSDFEGMASTLARRTTFINNVMNFVNQYNLDAVDIDWEYPVAASAANFELLMDELGKALHAKGKYLTAAVIGEGAYYGQHIRNGVFADVDWLNIMAYDGGTPHSTYNFAVACINYWKGRGLAKEKIVLGVPFYGKSTTDYVAYNTICTWDANAQNKDVVNGVYYNGIPTMKAKTKLAVQQAGGIMIWELSQDATGSKSLLTAINDEMKANGASMKTGDEEATEIPETITNAGVYPNPLENGNATLSFTLENEDVVNISVYDVNGKLVFQHNAGLLNAGENTVIIDTQEMSTGLYLINISSSTENKTLRLIHK